MIWNRDNAEATWNVQVGDKITVEEYLKNDSTSAEIEPSDFVCVGRSLNLIRGQEDVVKLEIGGDILGYTEKVKKRIQQLTGSSFE